MNTTLRTHVCVAFAFLVSIGMGRAQKQPDFKWKIYVGDHDGDKRVYVHDSLPVYFFMSADNDPKNAVRLESKSNYANPMEFDGNGRHYLRHKDKDYEHEILFEVWADGYTPKTTLNHKDIVTYTNGGKTYTQKGTSIGLSSTDAMSGVQASYHSLDKSEFAVASSKITLSEEREYFYQYFSVDNVGNAEKTNSITYIADGTAPTTKHELKGDQHQNILSASSKIELTAEDASSGLQKIRYSIDDGSEKTYSSAISMYNVTEGEHTLTYYAIDNVDNKETAKKFTFFVDKTPPVVTDEVIGDKFVANGKEYVSERSKYKLVATDNKAGIKEIQYSINGQSYATYNTPIAFDPKMSNIYIKANATDNVNNKSKSVNPSKHIRYIDTKAPILSHSFDGPTFTTRDTTFISDKTKIKLKAVDYASGVQKIEYKINASTNTVYNDPFNIEKEGVQNIAYNGLDNVNNQSNNSFFVVVDKTAPEIFTRFSIDPIGNITLGGKSTAVYSNHTGIFLSATDKVSGLDKIYYKINGGTEVLYTEMISGLKKGQTYVVDIRSLDKLGNESTSKIEFSIFDENKIASATD